MNSTLENLKLADQRLNKLKDLKISQDFMGPGLSISIGIGPEHIDEFNLEFGVSADVEHLIQTLIESQEDVRLFWMKLVKEELAAINKYLSEISDD